MKTSLSLVVVEHDPLPPLFDAELSKLYGSCRTASELVRALGVSYTPLADSMKAYSRSGSKWGNAPTRANGKSLGSLGPFVFVSIENGKLANHFRGADFAKPMSASAGTIIAMHAIFNGGEKDCEESRAQVS